MNKKGFTLIELITTFALATVLVILLMNIIVLIKNIYTKNNVKSELLIEQSNLSHLINEKFDNDFLDSYVPCSDTEFCYSFNFVDGTTSKLVVDDKYIKFDSYIYKVDKSVSIGNPTLELIDIEVTDVDSNNSFLVIKIPVMHKLYPKQDFGINIVYQYNSNKITL